MREELTRRRMLVGTGTAATGTLGGIALTSQNATATVDGTFEIPTGKTVLADTQLQDIRLEVIASWSFESNAPIHSTELELYVGKTVDTADLIARETKDDLSKESLSGETTLNGSLMSSSDFAITDFEPSNGELRRTVVADLRLYTLRNEEVVAEGRQTTTFDVVLKDEALQVEMDLSATGEVTFTTA